MGEVNQIREDVGKCSAEKRGFGAGDVSTSMPVCSTPKQACHCVANDTRSLV